MGIACPSRVGNEERLALAIRTILATTRVAVKSNQAAGRDDLAFASARRGEALLDDLSSRLPPDASAAIWEQFGDARGRLATIAADAAQRALSIGAENGSFHEDVDVRPELGSKLS